MVSSNYFEVGVLLAPSFLLYLLASYNTKHIWARMHYDYMSTTKNTDGLKTHLMDRKEKRKSALPRSWGNTRQQHDCFTFRKLLICINLSTRVIFFWQGWDLNTSLLQNCTEWNDHIQIWTSDPARILAWTDFHHHFLIRFDTLGVWEL